MLMCAVFMVNFIIKSHENNYISDFGNQFIFTGNPFILTVDLIVVS